MTEPMDMRGSAARFLELAEEAAKTAPTREELAEHDAAAMADTRSDRLDPEREFSAGAAILPADREAIVRGTLAKTHALRVVEAWRGLYRGGDERSLATRREFVPFLTLYGPTGLGKTVAGAWLLAYEGGLYVSVEELRRRLTSGHWRDASWADQVLRARVVVLDDVGTEDGDARAAMFELVNRRQGLARAMTLITSNLVCRDDFVQRYDERVVRRLEHAGRMVECKGTDMRRRP